MRNIEEVLDFREDISPFLIHLTRASENSTAKQTLHEIIRSQRLEQSGKKISDVRFGCNDVEWSDEKKSTLFSAICFTETPLNEVHCLLEIDRRSVQLEPYGIVFLKDRLAAKNVSPVLYLNNNQGNMAGVVRALGDVVSGETYPEELNKLYPLFSSIGQRLSSNSGTFDFSWEREWRLPYCYGALPLDAEQDVFIGLCPDEEIDEFERTVREAWGVDVPFIDPRRNAKWYAKKLIDRRKKFGLTISVV